jgi:hypothetical protein
MNAERNMNGALAIIIMSVGTIFGALLLGTDVFGLVNLTSLIRPPWDWVATWAYLIALANLAMWKAGYFSQET